MLIGKRKRGNGPHFWLGEGGGHQCGNRGKRRRNPQRRRGRGILLLNHRFLHSPPRTDLKRYQFVIIRWYDNLNWILERKRKRMKEGKLTRSRMVASWRGWKTRDRSPGIGLHETLIRSNERDQFVAPARKRENFVLLSVLYISKLIFSLKKKKNYFIKRDILIHILFSFIKKINK